MRPEKKEDEEEAIAKESMEEQIEREEEQLIAKREEQEREALEEDAEALLAHENKKNQEIRDDPVIGLLPNELRIIEGGGSKKTAKRALGVIHIDVRALPVKGAKGRMIYIAIDTGSNFAHYALAPAKTAAASLAFLEELKRAFPFKIRRIITPPEERFLKNTAFKKACKEMDIQHALVKENAPLTRPLNRLYESLDLHFKKTAIKDIKSGLRNYLRDYNHSFVQEMLGHKTPFEILIFFFQKRPSLFHSQPRNLF